MEENRKSPIVGRLKSKLRASLDLARSILLRYPHRVGCNLCEWRGRHFVSDEWHDHVICPQCGGSVRHRLLFACLTKPGAWHFDALIRGRRILHFAPEAPIRRHIEAGAGEYRTADRFKDGQHLQLDIADMREVGDGEVDIVIACDVLEHVADDHRALREMYRVLSPGGTAIITVPQKDGLASTFEDDSITDDAGREAAFGQHDHLRIYGDDFGERVAAAGFKVDALSAGDFSARAVSDHVLAPPRLSSHPLATNQRSIFLAQKPVE